MESIISIIHLIVSYAAFAAWGLGMYYWWQTNNSLRNGISKFILLNPASYFVSSNFTEAGIVTRNRAVASFVAMLIFAVFGYGLRLIKEASI